MPKESFKNGKLTLTYDLQNNKDKTRKIKQDLKKGKKKLSELTREELELVVSEVMTQ